MAIDLLEVKEWIELIRANTWAVHLPANSQEKANNQRAETCNKKREALAVALKLIEKQIKSKQQESVLVWVFSKEGFLSVAQDAWEKKKMQKALEVNPRAARLTYL